MLLKSLSDPKLFLIRTDVSVAQALELWIMEAAVVQVCCTATTLGAKHKLKFKKIKIVNATFLYVSNIDLQNVMFH